MTFPKFSKTEKKMCRSDIILVSKKIFPDLSFFFWVLVLRKPRKNQPVGGRSDRSDCVRPVVFLRGVCGPLTEFVPGDAGLVLGHAHGEEDARGDEILFLNEVEHDVGEVEVGSLVGIGEREGLSRVSGVGRGDLGLSPGVGSEPVGEVDRRFMGGLTPRIVVGGHGVARREFLKSSSMVRYALPNGRRINTTE